MYFPSGLRYIYHPRMYVRRQVMFSQVCVCSTFGRGTPSQVWFGYPIPGLMVGGYPIPGLNEGYPGTPHHDLMGYPPHHDWMGYPPHQHDWMGYPSPPTMTGWGTPPPPTSIANTCVRAGGLSRLRCFCHFSLAYILGCADHWFFPRSHSISGDNMEFQLETYLRCLTHLGRKSFKVDLRYHFSYLLII